MRVSALVSSTPIELDDVSLRRPSNSENVQRPTNPHSGLPMYGNIGVNGLFPGDTYQDALNWFDSPTDFEYEHQARGFYHRDHIPLPFRHLILDEEMLRFNKTIERLVIQRCLPGPYKKEVGWTSSLVVGVVDGELWHHWVSSHSTPPPYNKKYKHTYPDKAGSRSEIFYQVGWNDGLNYPDLATLNWYFTKWYCDGIVYRGVVNKIFFIRNRFSDQVRVQFTYDTHRYDGGLVKWVHC